MLRRLAQRGTAILLITHHIADILPEIDRIVMMNAGHIVADGSKEDLLTASNWVLYSDARSPSSNVMGTGMLGEKLIFLCL